MAYWLTTSLKEAQKMIQYGYNRADDIVRRDAIEDFRDWCKKRIAECDDVLSKEE